MSTRRSRPGRRGRSGHPGRAAERAAREAGPRPARRSLPGDRSLVVLAGVLSLVGAFVVADAVAADRSPSLAAQVATAAPGVLLTTWFALRGTLDRSPGRPRPGGSAPVRDLVVAGAGVVLVSAVPVATGTGPGAGAGAAAAYVVDGVLLGALVLLGGPVAGWLVVRPALTLLHAPVQLARGRRVAPGPPAYAVLLLSMTLGTLALQLATEQPGRERLLRPLLAALGLRPEGLEVVSPAWLWVARALCLTWVGALLVLLQVGRRAAAAGVGPRS